MQHHLAILLPVWIELILDGSKTIGCWFTKIRCAPYGKVNKGDIIYMKESGGLVKGMFTASEVETFDTITSVEVLDIYAHYGQQIFGMRHFSEEWDTFYKSGSLAKELKDWDQSNYATLIHVANPIAFAKPFPFPKRDRRSWVVLDGFLDPKTGEYVTPTESKITEAN